MMKEYKSVPAVNITIGDVLMAYGYEYNDYAFGNLPEEYGKGIESKLERIAENFNRHMRWGDSPHRFLDLLALSAYECGIKLAPCNICCPDCERNFGVVLIDPNLEEYYTNYNRCRLCGNVWERSESEEEFIDIDDGTVVVKDGSTSEHMKCPECDSDQTEHTPTDKGKPDSYFCTNCGLDWFYDPK